MRKQGLRRPPVWVYIVLATVCLVMLLASNSLIPAVWGASQISEDLTSVATRAFGVPTIAAWLAAGYLSTTTRPQASGRHALALGSLGAIIIACDLIVELKGASLWALAADQGTGLGVVEPMSASAFITLLDLIANAGAGMILLAAATLLLPTRKP
ncbi:MAG: hypothetical protein Q4B10_04120 [Actinomycetaceae bacterium]|nr:hypothetical protein [Actinomycetaceae bacterium]